jgi:hypothetical protein
MVLGGLWHGAAWTFVLWGAFHGAGLVAEHALGGRLRAPAWLKWLAMFHLIVFGWILFRSESLGLAGTFLSRLAEPGPATLWSAPVVLAVVAVIGLPAGRIEAMQVRIEKVRPTVLAVGFAVLVALVGATVSSQGVAPFIYFRF